jgi:hypothetical protein
MLRMELLKKTVIACLLTACTAILPAQIFNQPNFALKSHETMSVNKVELTPERTVVTLSVENRITGGNFCADRNIYIIDAAGIKFKLIKAAGIPVCPSSYSFKNIGEVLNFTLEFPPISRDSKWIDILEDCTSNCFRFYGVTLDNDLNKKLDAAFSQLPKSLPSESVALFRQILEETDNQNLGIEGLLYITIITSSIEDNDKPGAMAWYKRLGESHAPRVNEYLKFLNDKGIKY